jgi:hypothetical protein
MPFVESRSPAAPQTSAAICFAVATRSSICAAASVTVIADRWTAFTESSDAVRTSAV